MEMVINIADSHPVSFRKFNEKKGNLKHGTPSYTEISVRPDIAGSSHIFRIGKIFYRHRDTVQGVDLISQVHIYQEVACIVAAPVIIKSGQDIFAGSRIEKNIIDIQDTGSVKEVDARLKFFVRGGNTQLG